MFPNGEVSSPTSESSDYMSMSSPEFPLTPTAEPAPAQKAHEEDAVDVVEMYPMLENENDVQAFSNPQYGYQNVLKSSDLDDVVQHPSKLTPSVFRF